MDSKFEYIEEILPLFGVDETRELADLLVDLMGKYSITSAFLEWLIRYEVYKTGLYCKVWSSLSIYTILASSATLYREDNFSVTVLNVFLYGELGVKYLNFILSDLIKEISDTPHILELSLSKVSEEECVTK